MLTGEIHILPTDNTPEFHFNSDGMFKIRGRGLYNNKTEDVEQVLNWITEYLENPVEVTYIVIALEYLNSYSTTIIVSILRRLNMVLLQSKKLVIQWYYEEDDEDLLERGEYISLTFDIPFTFILTDHISALLS
jgi:SiaC family regulatory phosphoprotein